MPRALVCRSFSHYLANEDSWPYIVVTKRTAVVRPRREAPVLVYKKCLKRSPDGVKIRRRLKRELKSAANGTKKTPRLVMTGCFKICPKAAVVLTGGHYVLVSRGR
jgi:hypothetical protein